MDHKHLFGNRAKLTVVAMGLLAALVVAAVPVGATVIDRGRYSHTDSFSYDDCGFPVEVSVEFGGVFRIRQKKKQQFLRLLLDGQLLL